MHDEAIPIAATALCRRTKCVPPPALATTYKWLAGFRVVFERNVGGENYLLGQHTATPPWLDT
jgi:hypothetical protein